MSEKSFLPVNRHLRISLEKVDNKTSSGVLLPESFSKDSDKYKKVTVMSAATDCKPVFLDLEGKEIFVEKSMIQEISVSGQRVALVLENYVIGVVP